MLPAMDASAPFGRRMVSVGVCSNESGIDISRTFMEPPHSLRYQSLPLAAPVAPAGVETCGKRLGLVGKEPRAAFSRLVVQLRAAPIDQRSEAPGLACDSSVGRQIH